MGAAGIAATGPQAGAAAESTRIVVYGVEEMVPKVLDDAEVRAWLATPIAGAPLYRRLLEPLVGLNVTEIDVLDTGIAARALVDLMTRRSYFGTTPRLTPAVIDRPESHVVLFPGNMISFDADDMRERLAAVLAGRAPATVLRVVERTSTAEAVIAAGPAQAFLDEELLNSPQFTLAAAKAEARCGGPVTTDTVRAYRPDTPARLVDLARASLAQKLFVPVGHTDENGMLVGARAKISPAAVIDGAAAVGAESYVAPSAMLCQGSIVGENCYIGEGALVSDAVVLDGARVAPGEFVLSVVRGPKGKIEL